MGKTFTLDPKTPRGVTKYYHYTTGTGKDAVKTNICFCRPAEVDPGKLNDYDTAYAETHTIPDEATALIKLLENTDTIFPVVEKPEEKPEKKGKK